VHVQLAPGESLPDATRAAAQAALADPRVAGVLLPLRPEGERALGATWRHGTRASSTT
jgi:hypothetical protein